MVRGERGQTPPSPAGVVEIVNRLRHALANPGHALEIIKRGRADFAGGAEFSGNIGVRYVETTVGVFGNELTEPAPLPRKAAGVIHASSS